MILGRTNGQNKIAIDDRVILGYNLTIGGDRMENIRPSADLRSHYSEISKICRESREPVFITVNGRGDTVVLNYQAYRQMSAELELLRMLAEAQEDIDHNRVAPMEETFSDIRQALMEQDG